MGGAPSSGDTTTPWLVEAYEGLRRRHGWHGCEGRSGAGHEVLRRQGLAAWIQAFSGCVGAVAPEVALAVQQELEARIEEADALRFKQVERARYEAELARGRFMQVDPNHRLVADTLEADWNEKLRELGRVRDDYERRRQEDRLVLDEANRARIRKLAGDFPRLWRDPKTPDRERKRMARLLIEDVTLVKREEIVAHVRFSGGASRSLTLSRPLAAWETRQLAQDVVREIDRLLDRHTAGEVARILNERGVVSGTGKRFDARRVQVIRRAHGLLTREQRLRAQGLLTLEQTALRLGLHKETVKRQRREGRLHFRCHRVDDDNRFMYEDPNTRQPADDAPSAARSEEVQYA